MTIRPFQAGDDLAQVSIYNEAAAGLPKFKPATVDEVRRRVNAPDFDPATRLFALAQGRPVGYVTLSSSGRLGYPWCRKGHEELAGPLFDAALAELKRLGVTRAFAAYRGDWAPPRAFFLERGFTCSREMVNFVMDLAEMPTPSARSLIAISPVERSDVPAMLELGRGLLRSRSAEELERQLFESPYFPPSSLFAIRPTPSSPPAAVGIAVTSAAFAPVGSVDPDMPCFRLGAFGTEGLTHKRINGLFSVLAANNRDIIPLGLDLLAYASRRLEDAGIETMAAQVPSDAAHLVRFYRGCFRRQGAFPLYERHL
jgi:hypothetical protein